MNIGLKIFRMQTPGSCTGMYWRGDPRQGKSTHSENPDWPRNGSILKGTVHQFESQPEDSLMWLEVAEYK